jgi:pimeloyl-ACP methyl ester carboxylesterase
VELEQEFQWRGRRVRWGRAGSGPDVVFCHGTPWSSELWRPFAEALVDDFTVHRWDMPGYGQSSKDSAHRVSLDVQGELFADLLREWNLDDPHVVAHDFGGAVALRAACLHDAPIQSFALVDVVALRPWGSPFFRLVREHADVFAALPPAVHEGLVRSYIAGASFHGVTEDRLDGLVSPWRGAEGQAAFYRQIAQADEAFTGEVEARYPFLEAPCLVVWGQEDQWLPVEQGRRLARLLPDARLQIIPDAGHLVQFDQPVRLATVLHAWLREQATPAGRV